MATERQIRANRANAKKSTGLKTAAGRLKSSQNAFRHGLSIPLKLGPEMSEKANLLVKTCANEGQYIAMSEIVHAQLDLLRIRTVRNQMLAEPDLVAGDLDRVRRLKALDRYERMATTRRRRAAGSLPLGLRAQRHQQIWVQNLSERTQFRLYMLGSGIYRLGVSYEVASLLVCYRLDARSGIIVSIGACPANPMVAMGAPLQPDYQLPDPPL